VHQNGSGEYNANFEQADRSAFAFGPKSRAKVVNQGSDSPPAADPTVQILGKLDELIRGVEQHWAELADPGDIRHDLKAVRTELRDQEPDTTTIGRKVSRAMTRLAPVTALAELAASIAELVSHLH
jgi:hypothetical protein